MCPTRCNITQFILSENCSTSVVCAPDDGWWYRSKHIEQFSDKINCVMLHLVGYILEEMYFYLFSL
jgi:hypothetical protein